MQLAPRVAPRPAQRVEHAPHTLPLRRHLPHREHPRAAARRPSPRQRPAATATEPAAPPVEEPEAGQQPQRSGASTCPFAPAAFAPSGGGASVAPEHLSLSGPGWRVLPEGNTAGLPGPQGRWCWNPLLGDVGEFEAKGAGKFLFSRMREFGPVFTFRLGQQPMVAVMDYELVRSLLVQGDSKIISGWGPDTLYIMLGESTRQNLEHPPSRALSRRRLAPGFSREALRGYLPRIEAICAEQLALWAAALGGECDLAANGKGMSFEFATRLLVDFDVSPGDKPRLMALLDDFFQGMFSMPIQLPGTRFSRGLRAKAALQREVAEIVRAKRAAEEQQQQRDQQQQQQRAPASVFDYNLEARRQMLGGEAREVQLTDMQVADIGIGLIIAGSDTSGLGIAALMSVLALFPSVLERLRAEQAEVLARHGPGLTLGVLDNDMPYAEAVVREVLRLVPPSTQVMRRTLVDLELCGEYHVPAGSTLYLSTFAGQVLTDPGLGLAAGGPAGEAPGADAASSFLSVCADSIRREFKPERWLAGEGGGGEGGEGGGEGGSGAPPRPSGLLTFSAGPHVCQGLHLFMAEAKVLLALLARGYELEALEPEQLDFAVSFVSQLRAGGRVRLAKLAEPLAAPAPARPAVTA